jgi:hypothetical protein
MSLRDELPPSELAITSKALDIHRQSLIHKLDRHGLSRIERERTLQDIEDCSAAAQRFRQEHDALLSEQRAG